MVAVSSVTGNRKRWLRQMPVKKPRRSERLEQAGWRLDRCQEPNMTARPDVHGLNRPLLEDACVLTPPFSSILRDLGVSDAGSRAARDMLAGNWSPADRA